MSGRRRRHRHVSDRTPRRSHPDAQPWLVAATVLCAVAGLISVASGQPNIVLIVSDDAGYNDFGFMSTLHGRTTDVETPNLDALAGQSVVMTSGYVSGPLCSPSRAGLMTGQYQQRFGYEENIGESEGLTADQQLLSHQLKGLGYTTGAIGKWHLGQIDGVNRPLDVGFDEFFGFLGGGRPYWGWPGADLKRRIFRGSENVESQWVQEGDPSRYDPSGRRYLTDAFGEEAADFINRHAEDENPFFLYVSLNAPHAPFQAKQQDLDRFSGLSEGRQELAAMTYALDRAVGDITGALADNGLNDDTIVVFLNDNGGPGPSVAPYNNAPLRGAKGSLWEGGVRVPMLIRAPGLEAGTYDDPVISLDLMSTFVDAAGGDPDQLDTDGTDLLPFLSGEVAGDPHELLFWRSAGGRFAVRKGDWKLVRPGVSTFARLHNVADDVHEDNYLNSQHPEIVAELRRELTYWEATLDKPKWGALGAPRHLFDHFVFRNDLSSAVVWSSSGNWTQAGTSNVVTLTEEDAYANAVLEFTTRDDASYTATNDMRRATNLTFMLNQLRLTGSFAGATNQAATINGESLLLVKNLSGQLPQIRLEATASGTSADFTFNLDNELLLLDDLEITGDGTQEFVINSNIRDYYEPRSIIKSGTSTVTLAGNNTFAGSLLITNGEVKLSSSTAAIQGADAIFLGNAGKLTLEDGAVVTDLLVDPGGSSFNFVGGRLRVNAVSGNLENNGGIFTLGAPGDLTTINGDLSQNSGLIEIELGGASSGADWSKISVLGTASLNGGLDVDLVDGFTPELGQRFEFLTTVGGVEGSFTAFSLPALDDRLTWRTVYGATGVSLAVAYQGDYNLDGSVDAADYTVWRDLLGLPVALGSGPDGDFDGQITEADYALWRANFGAPAPPQISPIPGDYNRDGVVDAADYTVWRDAMESGALTLPNRDPGNIGPVNEDDYSYWRIHFGSSPGSGADVASHLALGESSGANHTVPEPTTLELFALVILIPLVFRRKHGLSQIAP